MGWFFHIPHKGISKEVPFCSHKMVKLKVHSQFDYDTFPDRHPAEGESYVDVWQDNMVIGNHGGIALLLEPRSMIGSAYEYARANHRNYKYIFTHDSELLKFENARLLIWADVWCTTDSPKTKGISLVSSWKNWCPLHSARLQLARHFENSDLVDVYGTYNDPSNKEMLAVPPEAYLENYKFSIIIENDIDEYWFTEKILNCFATKTVPIYVGATKIGDVFNEKGIIQVSDWREIPEIVKNLNLDSYESYRDAIEDNFERVKAYMTPWRDRFFREYEGLLSD